MKNIITYIGAICLACSVINATELNFKNSYELFRSAYEEFPEVKNDTRSIGTLGQSRYMATTHIRTGGQTNEEIKTLYDAIRMALADQSKGNEYKVSGAGPTGRDGTFDKFDIVAENKDFHLFLAVDYTQEYIVSTLVHIPKS